VSSVEVPFFAPAVEAQLRNNRETVRHAELYAPHRHQLREVILTAAPRPGGRLCVLGAGNAHSLDLEVLTAHFAEVCLVDLDRMALERAAARTSPAAQARLTLHAPIDASGLGGLLASWNQSSTPPADEALATIPAATAAALAAALPAPFDLVISDCILTQIHWSCFQAIGNTADLNRVIRCALLAHLHTLATLTRSGGTALLVTDAISSDSLPLWQIFSATDPAWLLAELDGTGALFSGTSPALVTHLLKDDPTLAAMIERHEVGAPWLWQQARNRFLLVYPTLLRRRPHARAV
jgi:hypothetical protein